MQTILSPALLEGNVSAKVGVVMVRMTAGISQMKLVVVSDYEDFYHSALFFVTRTFDWLCAARDLKPPSSSIFFLIFWFSEYFWSS